MAEQNFLLKALSIIKEQLPKFASEMNVPFSGNDPNSSVMGKESPIPTRSRAAFNAQESDAQEKRVTENIATLFAMLSPTKRAAMAVARNPVMSGVALATTTGDPTWLIPGKAGMVLGGSVGDAEAVIRPGGRPDLNMTHQVNGNTLLSSLQELANRTLSVLDHPSIAIASNNGRPFGSNSGVSLLLNPTSPLFDPATATRNQLFNRDAFTFRRKNKPDVMPSDVRMTEDAEPETELLLSLLASPRFRSFEEYEKSSAGAKLLGKTEDELAKEYSGNRVRSDFYDLIYDLRIPHGTEANMYRMIEQRALSGNQKAADFVDKVRHVSSGYGELKLLDDLPLNDNTLSAVMYPDVHPSHRPSYKDSVHRTRFEAQDALNVPVGSPIELLPRHMEPAYADLIDYIEKDIISVANTPGATSLSLDQAAEAVSPTSKKYIPEFNLYSLPHYIKNQPGFIRGMVLDSPVFASDVASMITARDVDVMTEYLKSAIK